MTSLFISYSRKDIEFARKLTESFQGENLDFWIDWEDIPPTVDWQREIDKGIEEADLFLFLISPDSARSKNCGLELDVAVKNGKRLIPIVVREIAWEDAPHNLRNLNYIFFRESDQFDAAFNKLLTAIRMDYEWAQTHRRLQVKALEWERKKRESSFLLRGQDLQDAEWQLNTNSSKEPHPTELQREYVITSRKAADRQKRNTISSLIGVVIVLAALAGFGLVQASLARANAAIAQAASTDAVEQANMARSNLSRFLGNKSGDLLNQGEIDRALLLSLRAYQTSPTFEALNSLRAGLESNPYLYKTLYLGAASTNKYSNNLVFDTDGNLLMALRGEDLAMLSLNLITGKSSILYEFFPGEIRAVTFKQGGDLFALSTGGLPLIKFYDTMTGQAAAGDIQAYDSLDTAEDIFVISPDGQNIVASLADHSVGIWDINDGKLKSRFEGALQYSELAYTADGNILVLQENQSLLLIDGATGQTIGPSTAFVHALKTDSIAISPDQRVVALGTDSASNTESAIVLWDIVRQEFIAVPLSRNVRKVSTQAFSSDSKFLAFSGVVDSEGRLSETIGLVDIDSKTVQELIPDVPSNRYGPISFTPDNQNLVVMNRSSNAMLFDIRPFHSVKRLVAGLETINASSITFTQDNSLLLARDKNSRMLAWDISTSQFVDSPDKQFPQFPAAGAWVEAKCIESSRTGCSKSTISLYDSANGSDTFKSGQGDISAVALSPDAKVIALGALSDSNDAGRISLLHVSNGLQQELPGFGEATITSMAFSPDGKFLAASNQDGAVVLYDLADLSDAHFPMRVGNQAHRAIEMTFSSNGQLLASASTDGVLLWDTATMLALVQLPALFEQEVSASGLISTDISPHLVLSSNDKWLAVRDVSGIFLWSIDFDDWQLRACQMVGREFSDHEWAEIFGDTPYQTACSNVLLEKKPLDIPHPTP